MTAAPQCAQSPLQPTDFLTKTERDREETRQRATINTRMISPILMVKASFQIRKKSVGVNAHTAQALGGVSLGRLTEQQEDDQRDECDGNNRADTEGQLAGDQDRRSDK